MTPGDESLCPNNASQCHTLGWYVRNTNGSFIVNNTEVRFLEGMHTLNTSIRIENYHNVTIVGVGSMTQTRDIKGVPQPSSWIHCNSENSGFVFLKSNEINITNFGFHYCGTLAKLCSKIVSAALFFHQGNNILLRQVLLNESRGVGLHLNNIYGSVTIHDSAFMRTSPAAAAPRGLYSLPGNVRIWFGKSKCLECSGPANMTISSSSFTDGQKNANGLEIIVHCPHVHVVIDSVTIRNNSGKKGGNLALSVTDFSGLANTNIIKITNSLISGGRAFKGGGMRFWTRTFHLTNITSCVRNNIHNILEVHNTNFSLNHAHSTGSAIVMSHYQGAGYGCTVKKVVFRRCFFVENVGNGSTIDIKKHMILAEHASPALNVSFEHCRFLNNSITHANGAIMNIIMTHVVILNCSFTQNKGTALSLQSSKLNVYDCTRFENNNATYGAAMKVCDGSLIFLNADSHMYFFNNTAELGGAVFVHQSCLLTTPPCVFQPAHDNAKNHSYPKLEFVNNSAMTAGDALYGGSVDNCYTILHQKKSKVNSSDTFKKIFKMDGQTGPSWVSSDPQGVCFCLVNGTFNPHESCLTNHSVINVYPGEKFSVSAITVGQLKGSTSGHILSSLAGENDFEFHKLVRHHDDGKVSNKCVNLTFTLMTNRSSATVILQPSVNKYRKSFYASFKVKLLPCPFGFQLLEVNGHYKCHCAKLFHDVLGHDADYISCDINTKTILLVNQWIGCYKPKNQSKCKPNSLVVSEHCGEYLIRGNRSVSVDHLSRDQCIKGRTGFLCGTCKPGYSHLLGPSPECKQCSNTKIKTIVYIFAMLLTGIAIVVFLTVLNITVTEGTLNGLIFYATVMYGNKNFFPNNTTFGRSLSTFVLALNLDPGRAGCVHNDMTGYEYVWWKFGLVFYLLLIQAIVIYLTRKFSFVTRLLGENVLKVLATLLFLSHSQLLFACFTTLWFAKAYGSTPNETTILAWHFDGTVPYLGFKHAILFVITLICSLIALLFMLSLFFNQCLQRWSHYWFLRWVNKLRPFFEVYTGPCNDNYRFWPGMIYLLRTGIFALDLYYSNYKPHLRTIKMILTSVICVLAMSLACIFPHSVYKKWYLNVLEFFFLLNVCITSICLAFMRSPSHVMYPSITLVAIVFFGIVVYHAFKTFKGTRLWRAVFRYYTMFKDKCRKRWYPSSSEDNEDELLLPHSFAEDSEEDECREPLLED